MTTPNLNARGRYDGMLQILKFNSHLYFWAVVVAVLAWGFVFVAGVKGTFRLLILGGSGFAMFWMITSLWASHLVYDRSEIFRWTWLNPLFPEKPQRWINIHAGLDEIGPVLGTLFPQATGVIFDIFDPASMTERSIEKARRTTAANLATVRANFAALPASDAKADAVFLIFAAHELRRPEARTTFFVELRRVLTPGGRVVLVEHLRDWKNFAAFGPGFVHFFSAKEWRRVACATGFEIERELGMTPFVRAFILRRPV